MDQQGINFNIDNCSAMTTASIEGITVNDSDKFSVFDGASCGEPFHAQQIHLDFTPNEEIDTDYVQKKCCAFWNFIHSLPELQNLRIMPEKNMDFKMSNKTDKASTSDLEDTATETQSGDLEEIEKENAVSVLKFANDKGLINRTFETKIKESHCTVGSREYRELEKPKKKKQSGLCKCRLCPFHPPEPSPLKVLVRSMQDWDAKHPKSMDGPSHPAPLHSCILQRKAECTCDTTHSDHSD